MSELKAYRIKGVTLGDFHDVYLKSEADKVIAELEAENAQLKKQSSCTFSDDCLRVRQLKTEVRKLKYKRCLAMAQEWRNYAAFCGMQSHCHNHRGFGKTAEKYTWKEIHAWKCVHRYKELAEKFKPNI